MKNDDSGRDWILAIPIALAALALMTWRRAHTISVQFGYELLSIEMWRELRFQVVAGLALTLVAGLIGWAWRKKRNR